jgi:hypothetical protein
MIPPPPCEGGVSVSNGCSRRATTIPSGGSYRPWIDSLDGPALAVSGRTECNFAARGTRLRICTNSLARSCVLAVGAEFGVPTQMPEASGSSIRQLLSPQSGLWGDTTHSAFVKRAVRRSVVARVSLLNTQYLICTFCPLNWRIEFRNVSSRLPYNNSSRGPCSDTLLFECGGISP